jgi:hypothetical protein
MNSVASIPLPMPFVTIDLPVGFPTPSRFPIDGNLAAIKTGKGSRCYDCRVFNFGKPKTAGDWIAHALLVAVAMFLVWWMLRVYVL